MSTTNSLTAEDLGSAAQRDRRRRILDATIALASKGGRLDPPLGLILDELANMFVWPALPTVLSDGGGIGIFTQVVFQSMSQAATVWSESEAQTIWNSAIVKVLLGGGAEVRCTTAVGTEVALVVPSEFPAVTEKRRVAPTSAEVRT